MAGGLTHYFHISTERNQSTNVIYSNYWITKNHCYMKHGQYECPGFQAEEE